MLIDQIKAAQSAHEALENALYEIEQSVNNGELTQEVYDFAYWETDLSVSSFTPKVNKLKMKPTPRTEKYFCIKCGAEIERYTKYRHHSLTRNQLVDLKCDKCASQNNSYRSDKRNKEIVYIREAIKEKTQSEIDSLKKMPYDQYLKSPHWQSTRIKALRRGGYVCSECGVKRTNKNKLHVHHLTYENRGCEKPEDLIVLCSECHHKLHDEIKQAK